MSEDDDDLIPLSALQHWLVCPRQCALIHIEQQWADNGLTAEGRVMHQAVDQGRAERRGGVRRVAGLPLRCVRLGLVGKADVVEFRQGPDGAEVPFPVEYKRGRDKEDDRDRVQLCAQALCLEEALGVAVPEGALFYGKTRRRVPVVFDQALRHRTEEAAQGVRAMLSSGRTPPPVEIPACRGCSLTDLCLPGTLGRRRQVADYFERRLAEP